MSVPLPRYVQVLIVGGGIAGTSLAYQLGRLGVCDLLLVERHVLTAGTSWHAAGLIMQLRPSHSITALSCRNVGEYAGLARETGQETGFKQNGTLAIARRGDRMREYRRAATIAGSFGIETALLTPREAMDLYPALDQRQIEGAFFIAKDGQLNPVDTVVAYARGARAVGARIVEQTAVEDIGRESGGYRVSTNRGEVHCETLVLACGLWTRELAARLGAVVPLHPCEHFYVVTEALDAASAGLPVLRDMDGHVYVKEDAGKFLVGAFEPDARPLPLAHLPADNGFIELPEDWDHFARPYSQAMEVLPVLEHAGIQTFMNGPESFTPDALFALGELPGLPGCYVSAGYNSEGFEMAPGASRALAEWIVAGQPTMDLSDVEVARFHPFQANRTYLFHRAGESLSEIYEMHWPQRQRHAGRPARKSVLHDRLAAEGACFGETLGWERAMWYAPAGIAAADQYDFDRPNWYEHTAEECRAARQNVAIFDLSSFGKSLVQGRDACAVLQNLCANNVDVEAGTVVYTHMLNARGGIEVDVTVNRIAEDRFMVVSSALFQARDAHWMERHFPGDAHVTLTDVTAGYSVLSVQGPNSRALLQRVSDADLSVDAFPFARSRTIDLGHARVLANRLTFIGELGWELYIPSDFTMDVYDRIVEAGREVDLRHAGYHALEHLRSERAYREFFLDLTPDDTPYEAGLGFTVKLDKPGGFIGRDAVAPQKGAALAKRIVNFMLEDPVPNLHGNEVIWMDGKRVGYLRSGVYAFTLGRAIGMGYVAHEAGVTRELVEGAHFEIEIEGRRFPATGSFRSFYDPDGHRVRI